MTYFLDTNILIGIVRENEQINKFLTDSRVFEAQNKAFISIVSAAEIESIARRNRWGEKRRIFCKQLIELLNPISIEMDENLIVAYADIDVFSQGKYETKSLPKGMSARNMGKNDLWIAATAQILNATLLTTDKDFEHLNDVFLNVVTIET
jgi:tRNA(fMet)-specific endonuclease VapC